MSNRNGSPEEQEGPGGLAAAARAVGRAFGLLRRKRDSGDDGNGVSENGRKRVAPASPLARKRARAGGVDGEALQGEVRRLEEELDQVYAALGEHNGVSGRPSPTELNALIERSTRIKELLENKRRELSKLERAATRERLLHAQQPEEKAAKPAKKAAPPKRARTVAAQPVKQKVARPAENSDGPERVLLDKLRQNLRDPDVEIRRAATARLGELESSAAQALLVTAVDDDDERVQAAALNALARQGTSSSAQLFRRHAVSPNPHLRLAALRGLARVDDPEANAWLIEALEDESSLTRRTAATLLGWRDAAGAVPRLILALRDDDEGVRAAAAASLGSLRQDRAVLPLIRALADLDGAVREAALTSLRTLAGDEVDIAMDPKRFTESEIGVLKRWWRGARVERGLTRFEGLPEPAPPQKPARPAEASAPEPRPAPAREEKKTPEVKKPPEVKKEEKTAPAATAAPPRPAAQPAPAPSPAAPKAPADEPGGLDDLLGAEFQATETIEAEPADEDEAGLDSAVDPLDGLLSDLGARPSKPKE